MQALSFMKKIPYIDQRLKLIIIDGIAMQADSTPFNLLSLTYAGCSITGVRRSARAIEVTTRSNLLTVSIGITRIRETRI